MRKELLYNPFLLSERLLQAISRKRRLFSLKNTCARSLRDTQISTYDFLNLIKKESSIKCIVDAGANVGSWSLLANHFFPGCMIFSFEPLPEYFKFLRENTLNIPSITCINAALSDKSEEKKFYLQGHSSSFMQASNELLSLHPNEFCRGELLVRSIKLDDFISSEKIASPDLIKLDVEGAEIIALEGARHILQTTKYIILEVSFVERHLGQPLIHEIIAFMAKNSFYLYAFPHDMPLGSPPSSCDLLFKKIETFNSCS